MLDAIAIVTLETEHLMLSSAQQFDTFPFNIPQFQHSFISRIRLHYQQISRFSPLYMRVLQEAVYFSNRACTLVALRPHRCFGGQGLARSGLRLYFLTQHAMQSVLRQRPLPQWRVRNFVPTSHSLPCPRLCHPTFQWCRRLPLGPEPH
jgi:hypothetical protein